MASPKDLSNPSPEHALLTLGECALHSIRRRELLLVCATPSMYRARSSRQTHTSTDMARLWMFTSVQICSPRTEFSSQLVLTIHPRLGVNHAKRNQLTEVHKLSSKSPIEVYNLRIFQHPTNGQLDIPTPPCHSNCTDSRRGFNHQ